MYLAFPASLLWYLVPLMVLLCLDIPIETVLGTQKLLWRVVRMSPG